MDEKRVASREASDVDTLSYSRTISHRLETVLPYPLHAASVCIRWHSRRQAIERRRYTCNTTPDGPSGARFRAIDTLSLPKSRTVHVYPLQVPDHFLSCRHALYLHQLSTLSTSSTYPISRTRSIYDIHWSLTRFLTKVSIPPPVYVLTSDLTISMTPTKHKHTI